MTARGTRKWGEKRVAASPKNGDTKKTRRNQFPVGRVVNRCRLANKEGGEREDHAAQSLQHSHISPCRMCPISGICQEPCSWRSLRCALLTLFLQDYCLLLTRDCMFLFITVLQLSFIEYTAGELVAIHTKLPVALFPPHCTPVHELPHPSPHRTELIKGVNCTNSQSSHLHQLSSGLTKTDLQKG